MVEEARGSALSRLAGVTRKSLVRRLSSVRLEGTGNSPLHFNMHSHGLISDSDL